jgi:hypothetical protein
MLARVAHQSWNCAPAAMRDSRSRSL